MMEVTTPPWEPTAEEKKTAAAARRKAKKEEKAAEQTTPLGDAVEKIVEILVPPPPALIPPEQTDIDLRLELLRKANQVLDLVLSKRADYGTMNINLTGQQGVAVRLVDKVARLLVLTLPGADIPNHESIKDTWADIVGYGLIGLTLEEDGEW